MVEKISEVALTNKTNALAEVKKAVNLQKEENLSEMLSGITTSSKEENKSPNNDNKNFFANHKKTTIFGALALIGGITLIIGLIGKNPAKAAKFLQGNSKIPKGSIYQKAQKIADELLSDTNHSSFYERLLAENNIAYSVKRETPVEQVLKLFKKPNYSSEMSEKIVELEKYLELKPEENAEILKIVKSLKDKLEKHLEKLRKNAIAGGEINYKAGEEFAETVKTEMTKITEHLEKDSYFSFPSDPASSFFDLKEYISQCPENLLNSRRLYHGTISASGIYKNGFNPFPSSYLCSVRELGAGVYLTPDKRVANMFTQGVGKVIPVKLSEDAKIAFVSEKLHGDIAVLLEKLLMDRYGFDYLKSFSTSELAAIKECLIRKMFLIAGYDGAYMPKAMQASPFSRILCPDVNIAFGKNQSQVIIFNPEKTQISNRGMMDRIKDIKDNISALITQFKNAKASRAGTIFGSK